MNKPNGKDNQRDFVAQGFHRLDKHLITARPPKIRWGPIYKAKPDADKIAYLEKLAAAMNQAAHLIQTERDQLGEFCEKKEEQIKSLKIALDQNNAMIQQQIEEHNADKQDYNKSIADLKAKVRRLENGDLN